MKGRLLFLISLLIVPRVAQAAHRRTADFSAAVARSAAYEVAIKDAAARHSVDPRLLWTVAYLESRFQPRLVSRKGARGMMQFMPATGRRYGLVTLRDFHDPLRSIEAAALYLRDLNAMFSGRIDLILAGYNAGENAVIASDYRVPRYYETRSYVARGVALFGWIGQIGVFPIGVVQPADSSRGDTESARALNTKLSHPYTHRITQAIRPTHSLYFSF